MDYRKIYDLLYKEKYINDDQSSHLYDARYPKACLMYDIDSSGISYDTILDVGCGRGNGLAYLKSIGKTVAGVEISPIAVEVAKSKGLDVQQGSITDIPHEDGKFDLVVSTDVLEHLDPSDVRKAVAELARVSSRYIAMKIATDAERGSVGLLQRLQRDKKVPESMKNLHLTIWPPEKWQKLFEEEMGLERISFRVNSHPKFGKINICCAYAVK